MTARNSAGQFAKVTPGDQVIDAACAEVIARCQSYLGSGCSPALANTVTLMLAAGEADALTDGAAR